jgi:DNA-binding GntR family transcriptional regulator
MRLQLDEDAPVIVRRRIFLLEEPPAALTDSYYPADMAGGAAIEQPARIKGGVHALIEDPDGPIRRQVACSVDDITGRMPTPEEARELKLPRVCRCSASCARSMTPRVGRLRSRAQSPPPTGTSSATKSR